MALPSLLPELDAMSTRVAFSLPELREYQLAGYALVCAAVRELRQLQTGAACAILLQLATGGGKTVLALTFAARARAKGHRTLFVAHRDELLTQPLEKALELGWPREEIAMIRDGVVDGDLATATLVIGSLQTLLARALYPDVQIVVLDEARHHVGAPEWCALGVHYRSRPGVVILGLDATPARADGSALGEGDGGLFDRLVPIASISELVAARWLVPMRILAPDAYQKTLSDTPVNAYRTHTPGRRCIVFCSSIAESKRQTKAFIEAGYRWAHIDGKTHPLQRRAVIDRLRSGELQGVCNAQLLVEGLDVPQLEVVIVARGVAHPTTWIQILGRALRTEDGKQLCQSHAKQIATCIDLRGYCHMAEYGYPEDPREWSLAGEAMRMLNALPTAVQCRACLAWSRGGTCRFCGAELPPPPPPKVTKRELKEQRRRALPREGARWEAWVDLVRTADAREYKPSWASIAFQRRFGHYPKWGVEIAREHIKAKRVALGQRQRPQQEAGHAP